MTRHGRFYLSAVSLREREEERERESGRRKKTAETVCACENCEECDCFANLILSTTIGTVKLSNYSASGAEQSYLHFRNLVSKAFAFANIRRATFVTLSRASFFTVLPLIAWPRPLYRIYSSTQPRRIRSRCAPSIRTPAVHPVKSEFHRAQFARRIKRARAHERERERERERGRRPYTCRHVVIMKYYGRAPQELHRDAGA